MKKIKIEIPIKMLDGKETSVILYADMIGDINDGKVATIFHPTITVIETSGAAAGEETGK